MKSRARDIVVVGTSAGGFRALRQVLAGFPADFPASIFIVLHLAPSSPGAMPELLDRVSKLPVRSAVDGHAIARGAIYVAPADRHLMLIDGHMRVIRGPKENRHRPSIDALFRSAAEHYGPRVIGVILTGLLDDGRLGLWTVKDRGGIAIAQNPADAEYPDMPANAIREVEVDHVVNLGDLAPLLDRLVRAPTKTAPKRRSAPAPEMKPVNVERMREIGESTGLTCPTCHGGLWMVRTKKPVSFRCHVGHVFSAGSLVQEQADDLERALGAALRSLHETASMNRRLAQGADGPASKQRKLFERRAREYAHSAKMIERMLYGASRGK